MLMLMMRDKGDGEICCENLESSLKHDQQRIEKELSRWAER